MRNFFITLSMALIAMGLNAQTQVPQGTYTDNATFEDPQRIIISSTTIISPTTGKLFIARILGGGTPTDPYSSPIISDENYVFTRSFQTRMDSLNSSTANEGDVIENITYYDGLGRPMQQVAIKATPDYKDLVTHIGYDGFGRQDKDWLPNPISTGSLGSYRGDISGATQQYYLDNFAEDFPSFTNAVDVNAYSQKEFESSPLNRVLKQGAPGEDWKLGNDHEIRMDYQTNAANEVRLFKVSTTMVDNTYTPTLVDNNEYYSAGELQKTVTRDENHDGSTSKLHTIEEFTDKQGRILLKRTYAIVDGVEEAHNTYYVYDDFGNLTYVTSPKVIMESNADSVSQIELNELCYQYVYDYRNRLVEKKIPGRGWEYIVYNTLDQPIMTQDANQRAKTLKEWSFIIYDIHGRVAYTGIAINNETRPQAQSSFESGLGTIFQNWSTQSYATARSFGSTTLYYNQDAYPKSTINEVLTINYYDEYVDLDGLAQPTGKVFNQDITPNVQGLPTVSKVKVLGENQWVTTVTGYDSKGRVIYTHSKNPYLGTEDIVEMELDFAGKVIKTRTTHKKAGKADIVTMDHFEYDHMGRLKKQEQELDGTTELIAANTYDDLGQLVKKDVGNSNTKPLQEVNYNYNVRGWLTNINDIANLGSNLFSYEISYNMNQFGSYKKFFNGNISDIRWQTANDNLVKRYTYDYDALNRIKYGNFLTIQNAYNEGAINYDKNGNLTRLTRRGGLDPQTSFAPVIDGLIYSYVNESNKLISVSDSSNKSEGFNDGNTSGDDYNYDQNGNMTQDLNKGITDIEYNHLNLPTKVTVAGASAGTIDYHYDANGTKLKKTVSTGAETEYAAGYVYSGNQSSTDLQFFPHPEGYVAPIYDQAGNVTGYDYVYQYKDHLGNVRLSYQDINNDGAVDQSEILQERNYYPFGLEHRGYNGNIQGVENDYITYNGKEWNESLGLNMYEMDLRQYDPAIARWTSIDPVTHYSASTYNAFDNNPIFFADPSGANSTAEWMKANGITQDDLITIYQAPSDEGNADGSNDDTADESESNEDCCGKTIGGYKHKMTPKERRYFRNNPDKKKIVQEAAYNAGVLATKVAGGLNLGGDNYGYSGAIRHSYWMYLIAVELGPELAEKLGMLHEDFIITAGEHVGQNNLTTRDSKMDQVNNAFGISIARKNPNLTDLEFEDIFLKTVNHKDYQKLIKIFDTNTIPKQSLKVKAEKVKRMNERTFARFGEF